MSLLEHDLLVLRQDLQSSAQREMSRGGTFSMETLAIESELREVQQRASELQKKRNCLIDQVDKMLQKRNKGNRKNDRRDFALTQTDKTGLPDYEEDAGTIAKVFYSHPLKSESKILQHIKDTFMTNSKEKEMLTSDIENSIMYKNSNQTCIISDEKHIELIDLLTVQMFQSDEEAEANKKSNSLPGAFEENENLLQKPCYNPQANPTLSCQLTAYERLFGSQRQDSRSNSPVAKERKKIPVFIPKSNSKARHSSGTHDRSDVPEALGMSESKRLSSKSEENVSTVGRSKNASQTCNEEKHSSDNREKRSSKISLDLIDSLFAAPDKIVIPERLIAEEVKLLSVLSLTVSR